ncbi:unnamed protein product [Mycena citricolor]|uniref:Uncharacterized protein n=1 Tax=Mycena citricolor TaxID=2018698 RepID=A0AAD2K0J5_9AGAR|nr:unnamed protein product [Mycena citricolor]
MRPRLPPELEYRILREVAVGLLGSRKNIIALLLVCHRAHIWIEPVLYTTICTSHQGTSNAVLRVLNSRPPHFLAATRHLFIAENTDWDLHTVERVLAKCVNLQDLFIPQHLCRPSLIPLLSPMPLESLSAWLQPLFGLSEGSDWSAQPILMRLRRLEICGPMFKLASTLTPHRFFRGLAQLSNLETIAFHGSLSATDLSHFLSNPQDQLHIVAVLFKSSSNRVAQHILHDQFRIVRSDRFVLTFEYTAYDEDWEKRVTGRPCFWDAADRFVRRKRIGDVVASRRILSSWK